MAPQEEMGAPEEMGVLGALAGLEAMEAMEVLWAASLDLQEVQEVLVGRAI